MTAATVIVTNGDAAGAAMHAAGIRAAIVPWRDILHDGPVPLTSHAGELSALRAAFIAGRGWGDIAALSEQFAARDAAIAGAGDAERVVLWFEHDLYDQLQLLQALDALVAAAVPREKLWLLQAAHHLTDTPPRRLAAQLAQALPVTGGQLDLARFAWEAFRQPRPERWASLLDYDIAELPFLRPAVLRHLEEFPGLGHGLPRTELEIVRLAAEAPRSVGALFLALSDREKARFMGDWCFFARLEALGGAAGLVAGLSQSFSPRLAGEWLTRYVETEIRITPRGAALLAGGEDWRAAEGGGELWRGGVRLDGPICWRWDETARQLRMPFRSF